MPIMNPQGKVLGILVPVGGGDPIPLTKAEVTIGRRRSCDLCLDFNNISGRHCQLRIINGVWHIRDLGSTNGTSLNGVALSSEHTVMPDDEVGIASHLYTIDYEPSGPDALLQMQGIEEKGEDGHAARRQSILELAGIESDEDRPRRGRSAASSIVNSSEALGPGSSALQSPKAGPSPKGKTPEPEPAFKDEIPDDFPAGAGAKPGGASAEDDDFLKLFEEDVKRAGDKRENRK
jgi:hypothetical protein